MGVYGGREKENKNTKTEDSEYTTRVLFDSDNGNRFDDLFEALNTSGYKNLTVKIENITLSVFYLLCCYLRNTKTERRIKVKTSNWLIRKRSVMNKIHRLLHTIKLHTIAYDFKFFFFFFSFVCYEFELNTVRDPDWYRYTIHIYFFSFIPIPIEIVYKNYQVWNCV